MGGKQQINDESGGIGIDNETIHDMNHNINDTNNDYTKLRLNVNDESNPNIVAVMTNTAAPNTLNTGLWSTNDALGWSPKGTLNKNQNNDILPPTPPPPNTQNIQTNHLSPIVSSVLV